MKSQKLYGRRSGWHICIRRTFKGVNHIREFDSITNEKYREIISHQIIVTILGIELDRKAAGVSDCVSRTPASGNGRKNEQTRSLLFRILQEFRLV